MPFGMPDQNTHVEAAFRCTVHEVEEGATPPRELRLCLEESDTNPHRNGCRLDRFRDLIERHGTVDHWFDQISCSYWEDR
ncbi:MAG: hypothetical protein VX488_02205 [Actinomycetota bacterium]|nr:hypothetical protein [Actinomycetota bacterium]